MCYVMHGALSIEYCCFPPSVVCGFQIMYVSTLPPFERQDNDKRCMHLREVDIADDDD